MKTPQKPVIIAGAGPGGLTLALLLHQRNIPVRVFESVQEIRPLGVGINLLPHSVRVFHNLGLQTLLTDSGIETSTLHFCNKFGQKIKSEPRGVRAGYNYPQISIHRGYFQMLLHRETLARLGNDSVLTGHALKSWKDTADGVKVTLQTRAGDGVGSEAGSEIGGGVGNEIEVEGCCLIAADGIKSTARSILYPAEGQPLYSGQILWRSTTEAEPFFDGRTMVMGGTYDQKFVCYPISKQHAEKGRSLINWIAELKVPEWTQLDQNWINEVSKDVFYEPFASWKFDWLDVPALINGATAIYQYPMTDRDPLPRWTHGNMTLMGDAAHPMYPIGSNGASQAVLDAEVLANELASADKSTHEALEAYESVRRPATSKIVLANRGEGPDIILNMADERAPNGFENIKDIISQAEFDQISSRYKQTAGFAVKQVNG
ncbi:MAG: 2-polyprenyl-6-methoxyphenol hydroxylase-like FAD-dependent oxidoreductase [Cellvibrionaceae bacterium]|jgi:2-polyprenyl-6-methoxyphenol hydroxylase-like FAD-dependent oxidoreductase